LQTACAATVTSSGFVSFSGEPIELVNRARVPGTSKHTSTVNTMQPITTLPRVCANEVGG